MQFDVYKNPRGGMFPLLVDVQHELLARLATRVVVPMATVKRYGGKPITRLNPVVSVRGVDYVAVFQEMSAVPANVLADHVGTIAARRTDLVAALDLMFTGI
jgi:toxin CcdB